MHRARELRGMAVGLCFAFMSGGSMAFHMYICVNSVYICIYALDSPLDGGCVSLVATLSGGRARL